ncbi:unnamed protein product [Mesocestoides corti]|nr:unnamed protein product [Mesocestoides corti]
MSTQDPNSTIAPYESRLRLLSLKSFRLYLRASDQGVPARTTTAVLDIRLSGPSALLHTQKQTTFAPRIEKPALQNTATFREQKRLLGGSNHLSESRQHDNFISTESLIIIAVMVAAVAALLFIVVLLASACVRKRIMANQARQQCSGARKPTTAEFELQIAGEEVGAGGSVGSMVKKIYEVSPQPPPFIDSTSTYVTVTRNTLRRNNSNQRENVSVPTDLTTTYTVQSLDNLNSIQSDVISPYHFEKAAARQPGGILVQGPSTSLMEVDPRLPPPGPRDGPAGATEASFLQKQKVFSTESVGGQPTTTPYTRAGKAPVICSSAGTLSSALSFQTLPRNHPSAAYVALPSASVAYAPEAMRSSEGILLGPRGVNLGGKCLAANKDLSPNTTHPCVGPSFLIKLDKPAGFLLDPDSPKAYTPLNFTMSGTVHQPADGSCSPNQESSFV